MDVRVGQGKYSLGERLIAVANLWNERAWTTRVKFSRSHTVAYYTANIRSVLTFDASLLSGCLITDKDKETIHRVESKAIMIINSDISYK